MIGSYHCVMLAACLNCGYPIPTETGVRCSECGWLYNTLEIETMQRRELLRSVWLRRRVRLLIRWLLVSILIGSVWAGLLVWSGSSLSRMHLWVAATPVATVILSMLLVHCVSRCVESHNGDLIEACWSEAMTLLCLPWLTAFPIGVVYLATVWGLAILGASRGTVSLITVLLGMLLIVAWLLMILVGMMSWYVKLSESCFEYWVHECSKAGAILRVFGTLLMAPSIVSGVVMGVTMLDMLRFIMG